LKIVSMATVLAIAFLAYYFLVTQANHTPLWAHGDNMRQIHQSTLDNYLLDVKILPHNPSVGPVHFTIEPKSVLTNAPIEEALITVIVRQEDESFQSRAVNSTDYPHMYDANLTFHRPGIWGIQISMSSVNHGDSTTSFNMEISGVASVPKTSAGLFFLFVFSVIITGTVILYLRYRRPRVGTT